MNFLFNNKEINFLDAVEFFNSINIKVKDNNFLVSNSQRLLLQTSYSFDHTNYI